jgi:hypothetical protein
MMKHLEALGIQRTFHDQVENLEDLNTVMEWEIYLGQIHPLAVKM